MILISQQEKSKYIAFNSVPFSQIRSTDPIVFVEYIPVRTDKTSALFCSLGKY